MQLILLSSEESNLAPQNQWNITYSKYYIPNSEFLVVWFSFQQKSDVLPIYERTI